MSRWSDLVEIDRFCDVLVADAVQNHQHFNDVEKTDSSNHLLSQFVVRFSRQLSTYVNAKYNNAVSIQDGARD